jgi:hypothetical protein
LLFILIFNYIYTMKIFYKISSVLLMFMLFVHTSTVSAQSFELRVENENLTTATTYEFDVKLYATGATTTWEYATGTFYINMNSAFRNAGTITASIVASTSELNATQIPTSVSYNAPNNYIIIGAKTPPGAGAGSIITQVGTRVVRLKLTNTANFSTTAAPNLTWRWSTPNTGLSAYVGGVNTVWANNTVTAGQSSCKTPNYWNGTTWNKGLPQDTTDAVIFAGTYTGSLAVRSLIVSNNGVYNVADTNSLKVRTALASYGSCVFKSSALGTAKLLELPTTAVVSGSAYTVERFIPGSSGRRYRFLAAPFATGPAISTSWQQQIHITGNGTGGSVCPTLSANSNGFDATVNNSASMHTFNEATAVVDNTATAVNTGATVYNTAWTSIPSTTTTNLSAGVGYRVFVRGNRTQGCSLLDGSVVSANDVTLSASGSIKTGTNNFAVTYNASNGNGWNLVGNPYPAPINWDAAGWTKTNIDNAIWIFNPASNAYSNYNVTVGQGINGGSNLIESGSAFFVKANAASPVLTSIENVKSSAAPATKLFKNQGQFLRLSLVRPGVLQDELLLGVIPGIAAAQDEFDSEKMMNPSLNVYAINNQFRNGINSIPTVNDQVTIPLGINSTAFGVHKFSAKGEKEFTQYDVLLVDNYLGLITLLNDKPVVEFEINSDAASKGEKRFEIIFINKGYNDYLKNLASVYNNMNQLQVTPNPVQSSVKISCNTATVEGNVNFKVYNNIGQLVQQGTALNANLHNGIEVDLSARSAGVYFVEVEDITGKVNTAKLIKN